MDYLYENLGDERFQEFCSCLISKEFPNIQAFPVGQPDGGRDSLVYQMNTREKEFIVFQVKYVKNPHQDRDIHKWLTEVIDGEIDKINTLIPKGAKAYYLLTNVKGTAHLNKGSIDKVNDILEKKISIPSLCWWREDLSILFEKDPLFKWSFTQILNGQDILNSILFNSLNENKERREEVIRAYLTDQYEIDNEVKFKQIDLQNRLLNLFTDVPIRIKKFDQKNKIFKQALESFHINRFNNFSYEEINSLEERNSMGGAASFLLHPRVQNDIDRILLEGGPGQGKSTISQYISQVNRVRLLNKISDIDLLPENIKNTPIRLPFKIDLRDIATWIERKNPYEGILSEEYFQSIWKNSSLESFLIGHIFYHSKLEDFTSTDFIAICKLSPILFVFDGFDEIANIKIRGEVIDFINKGITRISANVKSIQVIITSRPAAFSDSVGFSIDKYPHFELSDITPPIINEYVEKWIKSSKLVDRDANELRRLIKDKLEMPHLKDLAKSPMQLAIFISLLRTKGQSLPNKRTALYDSYIELFFDRESEKSALIRDKRELIIAIHEYLAWILHSEAESLKNNGSIHIDKLNSRLKEYLSKEGHDSSITDELFDVMKERVCALVSRVQGTFEFEVQPLREYFCAKYLYKSAPHSSAGSIKNGTKPDRFHAILRNFYWQNVVRFFAGCADAGELDMIIQELKDLQNDEVLKFTNYPRIITSQILSDYVFTQKPLKLKDVVKIIVDGINIGKIINQDGRYAYKDPLLLPNECGRVEIVKECFNELIKFPSHDYAAELIGIINNNPLNNLENWKEHVFSFKGDQLTQWLEYGYKLQLIHKIDERDLTSILKEADLLQLKKRLQHIINGNRLEIINNNIKLKQIVFDGILNNDLKILDRKNKEYSLKFLTVIVHPYILHHIFLNQNLNTSFINHISRFIESYSNNTSKSISEFIIVDKIDSKINEFKDSIKEIFDVPILEFRNNIKVWDILVENGRSILGDSWNLKLISTVAAAIKNKDEISDDYSNMNNQLVSLCKRVRYARLKSGNVKYWERELTNSPDLKFSLLVFFTWATPKTIVQLLPIISKKVKLLDLTDFKILTKAVSSCVFNSYFTKNQQRYIEEEVYSYSDEIKYILSFRFDESNCQIFIYNNIKKINENLENTLDIKLQYLINSYLKETSNTNLLKEIKVIYKKINQINLKYFQPHHFEDQIQIPYEVAKKIMLDSKEYPQMITAFAEKACRLYANKNLKAIGEVAIKEKWFENN